MARTVIAIYDDFTSAGKAIIDLIDRGYIREQISFVSNDVRGEYAKVMSVEQTKTAKEGAVNVVQTQLLDLKRALTNSSVINISGIGMVVAAGPLAVSLSNSPELMRGLVSIGIPEQQAHYYAEGVRRGGTLVSLEASNDATRGAIDTLNAYKPVEMNKRVTLWQDEGWSKFDPKAEPLREEQLWPREQYRAPDESLATEHDEQLWPREQYRQPDEKVDTERVEELWPRDEYRPEDEKAQNEEGKLIYPREEYRHANSLAKDFPTPPGDKPQSVGVSPTPKEEQLWPREEYREPDETHDKEKERQLWPREEYRRPDEKVGTEQEEELWPRDEYRSPDEKTETEEQKLIYPRGDFRAKTQDRDAASGFKAYESSFRQHFNTSVSEPGTTFDQYQPAYHYGYNLAISERFKEHKEWDKLEPAAKRYWEERNPGTWDRYQACVRRAWEEVKGIKNLASKG
jgi:hypothetical protein